MSGKRLRIVLAGNPNCGKTTLFNRLTGSSQQVGNWPGLTVERKTGLWRGPGGAQAELADLRFAFRVAKHVKSNTIVYARDLATVGIGAGQMSRVDSARIAARKAQDAAVEAKLAAPLTKGSVVASDAFFPFADGLLTAIEAGATAVIQPGGSMRDDLVIQAADEHGIAMVFTGVRHFRH